ncbi:acetyl-CoA synthase subunit gamma [Candidatus Woesearchaeota archaeon]|nr:acetyl-CoA synthase subunit gamma [Candidatus Woesearchaeota archaeon]
MTSYSKNNIRKTDPELSVKDRLNSVLVRLTINRSNYIVQPGLYSINDPDKDSPVLVSSNYRQSFNILRKNLKGIPAWILVIDTKGINVWCSAGKGTFCDEEIKRSIKKTNLKKIVSHRKIILPQLSAPGVSAYRLKKMTGFEAVYGPVRAEDIPEFLKTGECDEEMRTVRFSLFDRLIVAPAEIVQGMKYLFTLLVIIFFIMLMMDRTELFLNSSINIIAGYLAGTVLGPAFLFYLPGRAFSVKGFFAGIYMSVLLFFTGLSDKSPGYSFGSVMIVAAISSFLLLNFTGSSTYTSLSGVKKEMRYAIPFQIALFLTGFAIFAISLRS